MRLAIDASNRTVIAGSDPARAVDIENRPRDRATGKPGRAYRAGRLICGCVHVTVSLDGRLGLTPRERRLVRVRFHEPLDDDLRAELTRLVRRRGAAARRAVERSSVSIRSKSSLTIPAAHASASSVIYSHRRFATVGCAPSSSS